MKHDLSAGDVAVVGQSRIEAQEDCLGLSSLFHQNGFLASGVGAVERNHMMTFEPRLVAFDVSDEDELGIFRLVD